MSQTLGTLLVAGGLLLAFVVRGSDESLALVAGFLVVSGLFIAIVGRKRGDPI